MIEIPPLTIKDMRDPGTAVARRALAGDGAPAARLLLLAGPVAGLSALDVGCGGGELVRRLGAAGARPVGLDVRSGNAGVRGDARRLPFRDGAFDLVACSLVLHYLDRPRGALAEIARVLRPRGRLLLADRVSAEDPDLRAAQDRIEWLRNPDLRVLRSPEELLSLACGAGFRVTQAEEFTWSRDYAEWMAGADEVRAAALRAEIDRRGDLDLGGTRISSGEVRLRVALIAAERR